VFKNSEILGGNEGLYYWTKSNEASLTPQLLFCRVRLQIEGQRGVKWGVESEKVGLVTS
jgi:hypothetical protein